MRNTLLIATVLTLLIAPVVLGEAKGELMVVTPKTQPEWMEVEVTAEAKDLTRVTLRIKKRKLIQGYTLTLERKTGEYPGVHIPVALWPSTAGFGTSMVIEQTSAASTKLTLTEIHKDGDGGTICKIDVGSYQKDKKDSR